jgi:hypothetical protein
MLYPVELGVRTQIPLYFTGFLTSMKGLAVNLAVNSQPKLVYGTSRWKSKRRLFLSVRPWLVFPS